MADPQKTQRKVKLKWPLENDLPSVFANQFAYVHSGTEVILVCGSFLPTGMGHRDSEDEALSRFLDNLEIKPEAKIVMTPAAFESLYNLLRGYFESEHEVNND